MSSEDPRCPDHELTDPCRCGVSDSFLELDCFFKNQDDVFNLRSILALFKGYSTKLLLEVFLSSATSFTIPEHLFPVGNITSYEIHFFSLYDITVRNISLKFQPNSLTSQDGLCKIQVFSVRGLVLGYFDASILTNCTEMVNCCGTLISKKQFKQ